jgi:hypothetical protein
VGDDQTRRRWAVRHTERERERERKQTEEGVQRRAPVVAKSGGAETGRTMLGLSKTGAGMRWWQQLLGEGGGIRCQWRFLEMGVVVLDDQWWFSWWWKVWEELKKINK